MDARAITFTTNSPQPAHCLKLEDCSRSHQPGEEKTRHISPKEHVLQKLQGTLLSLYSQLAQQQYALLHCTFQTLMNQSSQILCKPVNDYLHFTDGERRHNKMWMICLEEIFSRARNWTQTFQIAEHHPHCIQFQFDLLGDLAGIVPLVTSQCSCCSSLPQRHDLKLHHYSHFIQSKLCFHVICITSIMNYNSFSKKITLQSGFFLNWLVASQQIISCHCKQCISFSELFVTVVIWIHTYMCIKSKMYDISRCYFKLYF